MGDSRYVKFVSQKISKARWRPSRSTLQKPDVFFTGSWEDSPNSINVWSVAKAQDESEDDLESERLQCIDKCHVPGSVGDISFADPENFLAGIDNGDVILFRYNAVKQVVNEYQKWDKIHNACGVGLPCTGIDTNIPDVVTVGEDGSINVIRIGSDRALRRIDAADSCPISGVTFLKQNEICTVNKMGQLKIFDLRRPQNDPTRIIVTSEELIALESLSRHPTRPHILATGGADGCVTTFDTRKESAPITKLQVHDMEVWEVHFHPSSPENLFTCSEDGAVRKLDITSELRNQDSAVSGSNRPPVDVIELLNCHDMAVNSLSVVGSRLVCGTDSESIYVIENVL